MAWDEWFERQKRRFPFINWDIFGFPFFSKSIDEFMREIENRMDEIFKELTEKLPREYIRERKLADGSTVREMGPFVYGYSITIGPDGKPQIREFGNVKPRFGVKGAIGSPLDVREVREPLIDVIASAEEIKVVAELPGVDKKDIKVNATENTVTIRVDTPGRKYYKELELPEPVEVGSAKSTYNNGVLDITFKKQRPPKPKGIEVKIE